MVNAQLREVVARLESSLRTRHPELFDRRGQLRAAESTRLLVERSGGWTSLSGDELDALDPRPL
jgi:hypothetical protein